MHLVDSKRNHISTNKRYGRIGLPRAFMTFQQSSKQPSMKCHKHQISQHFSTFQSLHIHSAKKNERK